VTDLALSVPLPPGIRATAAVLKAPGDPDRELAVAQEGDRARVVVPRLNVYAVVHLTLVGGGTG